MCAEKHSDIVIIDRDFKKGTRENQSLPKSISLTLPPPFFKDFEAASRIWTTFKPLKPSVIGWELFVMQSKKC